MDPFIMDPWCVCRGSRSSGNWCNGNKKIRETSESACAIEFTPEDRVPSNLEVSLESLGTTGNDDARLEGVSDDRVHSHLA